jgi:hypothetical protein
LPPITKFLPLAGNYSTPIVDPHDNGVLQLSREEVRRGALALITANPLPYFRVGIEQAVGDHRNLFTFSQLSRRVLPYTVVCGICILAGVVFLYRRESVFTASVCMAYILHYFLLSLVQVAVVRYLIPFSVFYYTAFVCGVISIVAMGARCFLRERCQSG